MVADVVVVVVVVDVVVSTSSSSLLLSTGRCGLMVRALSSGFKSQSWQSVFSVGFFLLLLLHILHHCSIQSVVCHVCSLFEVKYYCGINSQPHKKAIKINLSLREEISMKNPGSAICGAKSQI